MVDADREVIHSVSMEEYTSVQRRIGVVVLPGSGCTFWHSNEWCSLQREPVWRLEEPSAKEIRRVLQESRAWVVTYNREPDEAHPQNAWLYVCEDHDYCLKRLPSAVRRNVKRALRTFRFEFVDAERFLEKGVVPFCDTRTRVGLSDGTPKKFRRYFETNIHNPAHRIVGAWKDDTLAAFLSLLVVDDWVVIIPFAATEHLPSRPNNGLIHFAIDYFIVQRKFRLVAYGLSSIQEIGKADGLHRFKTHVGFEARPVHRVFVFHPLLRPFINSAVLWALRAGVRLWPRSRVLRKAAGLLATSLKKRPPQVKSKHQEQESRE